MIWKTWKEDKLKIKHLIRFKIHSNMLNPFQSHDARKDDYMYLIK